MYHDLVHKCVPVVRSVLDTFTGIIAPTHTEVVAEEQQQLCSSAKLGFGSLAPRDEHRALTTSLTHRNDQTSVLPIVPTFDLESCRLIATLAPTGLSAGAHLDSGFEALLAKSEDSQDAHNS